MGQFAEAHLLTMGHEGGYANNKLDTGGETYKGISRVWNPNWKGWPVVDAAVATSKTVDQIDTTLEKNEALQANVLDFYKKNYWDVNRLDEILNQRLAEKLYDVGVNMGIKKAALILQEGLNLSNNNGRAYREITEDGIVGPVTLSLANKHPNPKTLYRVIQALQGERYLNIMRNKPSQETFANSWFSRV